MPPLHGNILRTYTPQDAQPVSSPRDLVARFHATEDDGHIIKIVRALLIAQGETRRFGDRAWVRIRDEDWVRVHCLLLRGVEGQPEDGQFVRAAGFEEAWVDVPKE